MNTATFSVKTGFLLTFACKQGGIFSVDEAEFNSLVSSLATSLEKSPK